jgi:DNA-binding NarL/FixJ family response regulator
MINGEETVVNTKVMIIDEQAYFRAGVRQALSNQEDIEVIECDPNGNTLSDIETHLPDIILLGSDLATRSGIELGQKIARNYPNARVIILSPDPNDEELFNVIRSAAVACLSKNSTEQELVNTIRKASRGEYPINETVMTRPSVAKHVLQQFQDMALLGDKIENVVAPLTKRETQILNYVADGNTNKQIANILKISEQTIKNHVSAILRKLNANDRAHAVVLAIKSGWIVLD